MNLWTESLWGDEGFSAIAVQKGLIPMLSVVMKDTAPPLFYLVGFLWGRLFGFSEVSLRSLTLLLMLGAAIFAGLIVSHIDRDRIKGLLAAGLSFFAPFLFPFAFEWRMYALLAFTLTASTYFFVRKKWGWYSLFALAALYTHHFAIFTVFAQGVWFLLTDFSWRKPKTHAGSEPATFSRFRTCVRELRPFLLIALGYSFWLYPFYIQLARVRGSGFWLSKPNLIDLSGLIFRFISGGVTLAWSLSVLALVAVLLFTKDWRRIGKTWLGLLFVFGAPIFLSYLLSQVVTPIFYDRYLLSAVVGVAVLLVLGVPKPAVFVGWILLALYLFFSFNLFTHPKKRPFRELAAYVKSEIKAGDELVNYNGRAHHLWESKYYGIPAPIYVPGEPLPLYVGTALMGPGDTTASLPEPRGRLVVIGSEPVDKIKLPGFRLTDFRQFGELAVSWWAKTRR